MVAAPFYVMATRKIRKGEMKFQELTHGKCAQDILYIQKIDEIPQYVSDRLGSIRTGCNNKCSGKSRSILSCFHAFESYLTCVK